MSCTVIATIVDRDGATAWFERGRLVDVASLPAASFDTVQPDVPIRLTHTGPEVGRLCYLEHGLVSTDLIGVGVADVEAEAIEDLFVSASVAHRGEPVARWCELRSLAVVGSTATVAARPLRVLRGDYRRPADRARWSGAPEIIARAVAATPTAQRWRRPKTLTIHRPLDLERRAAAGLDVDQRPAAGVGSRPAGAGPLEIRLGRILEVR